MATSSGTGARTVPKPLHVGDFVPMLVLPSAPAGDPRSLRTPGRLATLLVRVHHAQCEGCRAYLEALTLAASDFAAWDGRVVVLVPGTLDAASRVKREVAAPFTVLADEHEEGPLHGQAGVVIADRYDQIFHLDDAGAGHTLPAPRELEEWLKFLATQCPE